MPKACCWTEWIGGPCCEQHRPISAVSLVELGRDKGTIGSPCCSKSLWSMIVAFCCYFGVAVYILFKREIYYMFVPAPSPAMVLPKKVKVIGSSIAVRCFIVVRRAPASSLSSLEVLASATCSLHVKHQVDNDAVKYRLCNVLYARNI